MSIHEPAHTARPCSTVNIFLVAKLGIFKPLTQNATPPNDNASNNSVFHCWPLILAFLELRPLAKGFSSTRSSFIDLSSTEPNEQLLSILSLFFLPYLNEILVKRVGSIDVRESTPSGAAMPSLHTHHANE